MRQRILLYNFDVFFHSCIDDFYMFVHLCMCASFFNKLKSMLISISRIQIMIIHLDLNAQYLCKLNFIRVLILLFKLVKTYSVTNFLPDVHDSKMTGESKIVYFRTTI